jgi:hypothetical protein
LLVFADGLAAPLLADFAAGLAGALTGTRFFAGADLAETVFLALLAFADGFFVGIAASGLLGPTRVSQ